MKLFASLHTDIPASQSDCEAVFSGYTRVAVDYDDNIGRQQPVNVVFPKIEEDSQDEEKIRYIAFGPMESGDGRIARVIECIPHLPIKKDVTVRICVANIPEPLPENLHPVSAVLWHHINSGNARPEDLPEDLFEALNDEFQRVGLPIMRVTRSTTAKMNVKMSQMKSLRHMM